MKVLLKSPFSQMSGYGRDGIGLARAILDRKHALRLDPTHVGVPVPRDIAGLMTYDYHPPFDLVIHHLEPNKAVLTPEAAAAARYNVLWTMWGWDQLPDEEWVESFRDNVYNYDAVVAYDALSTEAFRPHVPEEKLFTILGGYESEDWKLPDKPVPSHPYTFGMVGKLTVRKGVYSAYTAFQLMREAHPECDAHLILRSTEPIFPPQVELAENVHVQIEYALPEDLRDFYWTLDTLLAPSMAEAKHLPPMEALGCGIPVILSDIPGHRNWATGDMVSWVKTVPKTVLPGYRGGEVKPEALAEVMWTHYTERGQQIEKARLGARTLPSMMDWAHCLERLKLRLNIQML